MSNGIVIKKVSLEDKTSYISMMTDFYNSGVVLQPIPQGHMERTFDMIMCDSPYADSYTMSYNDELAGYFLLSISYSNEAGGLLLWIEEIYVLPDFQGKGIGKEVFKFIESEYSDKVVRIRLEVEKNNENAICMYEKLGYNELKYMQMHKEIPK